MEEPILLSIANKEDRDTVAAILYRNGYRVEPERAKVKKSYEYYVKCELLENFDIQKGEAGGNEG